MINDQKRTCAASDIQMVAATYGVGVTTSDLSYAARCLKAGQTVLFVFSETDRLMVVHLDPLEGENPRFARHPLRVKDSKHTKYEPALHRKPGQTPFFGVVPRPRTTAQAFYDILDLLVMTIDKGSTRMSRFMKGQSEWPVDYRDALGKKQKAYNSSDTGFAAKIESLKQHLARYKAARLEALPQKMRDKLASAAERRAERERQKKAKREADRLKKAADKEAAKVRKEELASAKKMEKQAKRWLKQVEAIEKVLARKTGKATLPEIRGDLIAQRDNLRDLAGQLQKNVKVLTGQTDKVEQNAKKELEARAAQARAEIEAREKEEEEWRRQKSKLQTELAKKAQADAKKLNKLQWEEHRYKEDPTVFAWRVGGEIFGVPVRGQTIPFRASLQLPDLSYGAWKYLTKADGQPLSDGAKHRIIHEVGKKMEAARKLVESERASNAAPWK